MGSVVQDTQAWAQTNFASAELGDVRRTKRLVILAAQVAADPSASLPEQTGSWNDLRAAYNLFDCEDVTFQAIAAPHWQQTKSTPGELLLILEDTTEIDYALNRKIDDLSPVGSGTRQGFHLHSALMVSPADERIHGLAGQLIYHRQHIPKGETRTERLRRDDRESQIWCKLVDQIGSPTPGTTWVHVVDRGADDFEFFYHCQQTRTEWVARAKNLHRTIITPEGIRQELYAYLHTLPDAGSFTLELRARPNQPARTAKLVVSFGALSMPMPALTSPTIKELKPAPIPMHVVWVREVDAPDGVEPIEWVLYTSLRVESLDDAMTVTRYYEKRWLIEEWHKALKTGTQVQKRQLKTADRLEPLVGLMSVVAVRLLQLKGEARTAPERPAEEVVPVKYVKALKAVRKLAASIEMTAGRFFRELAKLGGFLGRRRDGEPGWITIWRGWDKLQTMIRGADAIMAAYIHS
jgi:Transposase DNA-binding/Transposase Tn5 dimerisation domain